MQFWELRQAIEQAARRKSGHNVLENLPGNLKSYLKNTNKKTLIINKVASKAPFILKKKLT